MKRKIIMWFILGLGIMGLAVFGGKWIYEHSKYVCFENKALESITSGSADWREFYTMEVDRLTKEQAGEITEIYLESLYGEEAESMQTPELAKIESFDDLLNFPNVEYIKLGSGSTYEAKGAEVREDYLEWFPVDEDAAYPQALAQVLGKLEKLEWVQIKSDLVFEDLQMVSKCTKLNHLEICQNQLKSLNGIADMEIIFAEFSENSLEDISALEDAKSIRYLILNENSIDNYDALLNVDGLKAVSFDMENENAKQVAEALKKKGCMATENVSDVYERYWAESEEN